MVSRAPLKSLGEENKFHLRYPPYVWTVVLDLLCFLSYTYPPGRALRVPPPCPSVCAPLQRKGNAARAASFIHIQGQQKENCFHFFMPVASTKIIQHYEMRKRLIRVALLFVCVNTVIHHIHKESPSAKESPRTNFFFHVPYPKYYAPGDHV